MVALLTFTSVISFKSGEFYGEHSAIFYYGTNNAKLFDATIKQLEKGRSDLVLRELQ